MNNDDEELFDIPVEDMTAQQLNAYLAHTEDSIWDLGIEIGLLKARQRALKEEIHRRTKGNV